MVGGQEGSGAGESFTMLFDRVAVGAAITGAESEADIKARRRTILVLRML